MYIKVDKTKYIWLPCLLGGFFQYEKAKIILEIEKTMDFNFFYLFSFTCQFFLVDNLVHPMLFFYMQQSIEFLFHIFFPNV